MKAFPIIVSSPSGAGKTTIVDAVLKRDKTVSRVITATTRAPRKGEKDGADYLFWSIKQFEQAIKKGQMIRMMATGTETLVEEVGARTPKEIPLDEIGVGEVGYLVTGLKDVSQVMTGDESLRLSFILSADGILILKGFY